MITTDAKIDLAMFIGTLKDHGATHLNCKFYGGGDSGEVESAFAYRDEEDNTEGIPDITNQQVNSMLSDWVSPHTHEYDWWNNEGGDGNIIIDLNDLTYETIYNICGEDKAEYEVDEETGETDWESAEPNYEYDTFHGSGTIKIE
jgi:hypothetical protein